MRMVCGSQTQTEQPRFSNRVYSIFHSKNKIPEDLDDTQKLLRSIRHPRLTHNHVHHRMKEQDSVFLIIGYLLNGEKSSVS